MSTEHLILILVQQMSTTYTVPMHFVCAQALSGKGAFYVTSACPLREQNILFGSLVEYEIHNFDFIADLYGLWISFRNLSGKGLSWWLPGSPNWHDNPRRCPLKQKGKFRAKIQEYASLEYVQLNNQVISRPRESVSLFHVLPNRW